MNNIAILELVLVGVIVFIQTIQALATRKKINILRSIIPNLDFFNIKKFDIPIEDLQSFQPKEILENLSIYETQPIIVDEEEYAEDEVIASDLFANNEINEEESEFRNEVSLINPNDRSNPIFESLLHSINVYLLRNKGATTDFNLIRDIIERNIDNPEESERIEYNLKVLRTEIRDELKERFPEGIPRKH